MFNHSFDLGQLKNPIRIICTGDWHIEKRAFIGDNGKYKTGISLFNTQAFAKLIDEIKKPNSYWLHVGDMFDDDRTTVRQRKAVNDYEGRGLKATDDDCADMDFWDRKLVPILKTIAHKSFGIVRGNHYRLYGNGITNIDYIAQRAGLKILGEHRGYLSLKSQWRTARRELIMYLTHGSGGCAKNDIGKLKDQSGTETADIVIGGHTHRLATDISAIRKISDGNLLVKPKIYLRCGSLRMTGVVGVDDYSDVCDYGALPNGCGILNIIPTRTSNGLLKFYVSAEANCLTTF